MIPKGPEDAHQEDRLMSGPGLGLIQGITVELRLPGLVIRCDGQGEGDAMNPVVDSLVQGGIASACVDGHVNVLRGWV